MQFVSLACNIMRFVSSVPFRNWAELPGDCQTAIQHQLMVANISNDINFRLNATSPLHEFTLSTPHWGNSISDEPCEEEPGSAVRRTCRDTDAPERNSGRAAKLPLHSGGQHKSFPLDINSAVEKTLKEKELETYKTMLHDVLFIYLEDIFSLFRRCFFSIIH